MRPLRLKAEPMPNQKSNSPKKTSCMSPLDSTEKSRVRPKLEGIFSLTPQDAETLMEDNPPGCRALLGACCEMADKAQKQPNPSREWFAHIMVQLPASQLVRRNTRSLRVVAPPHASLLHSYPVEGHWESLGRSRELPNRALFVELLQEELSPDAQKRYAKLLRRRPQTNEVAIGDVIEYARATIEAFARAGGQQVARWTQAAPHTPLPPPITRELRTRALEKFYSLMDEHLLKEPNHTGRETPVDELIAQALIHVEANRVLLEIGRYASLARDAVDLIEPFLVLLNSAGIVEVPELDDEAQARALFKEWLGKAGVLMRKAPQGAWRCLAPTAFSRMWAHAQHAANHYYEKGRGKPQVMDSPGFKPGVNETFTMLIALVACDFYKAKVPQETPGEKAPVYPVHSRRDPELVNNPLAPHALELVCMMYGQVLQSNEGWQLCPERVRAYADNWQYVRDTDAAMVYAFFKAPPAREVLRNANAFLEMYNEVVLNGDSVLEGF